jgi:L-ribulokinase
VAMQIYADILNRTMEVTRSSQTCALGSAMAGAVVAGIHPTFAEATKAMTTTEDRAFHPNPTAVAVYERLFRVYKSLHDAFGIPGREADVSRLMKDLLAIRDEARG